MTQIVSTLASLLARGSGIPATTPPPRQHCTHSSLLLLDLLQELVSLLALDMAAFLTVFGPLVQHCQQEAASTKLVSSKFWSLLLSLSKLMDLKTSLGSCPVAIQALACRCWLAG